MSDYSKMKQQEFDEILADIVAEMGAIELLRVPGIYEILSEHLNNAVLDEWRDRQCD